jgi:AAA domain/UvrD-like helicase C-terminal domain
MRHNSIELNEDQALAVEKMLEFIQDPDPDSPFFVLIGGAGTGKTFCMREVVARVASSRVKFAFTAPTNKAAKVLAAVTGEASTIYSLLMLRIDKTGELKKLVNGQEPEHLKDVDVIVLDEASMVNKELLKALSDAVVKYNLKVIFMGDAAQLPPVGEASSPVWALGINAELTRVMRHDNQILSMVTEIREVINHPAPSVNVRTMKDDDGGVFKLSYKGLRTSIYEAALEGRFADGGQSKVIAWRNVRVKVYNDLIRQALWGAAAETTPYFAGERIVAAAPCIRGEETVMTTDEEAVVESAVDCLHPLESKYHGIELRCRTETNKLVRLLVIHPASIAQFEADSERLAHDARAMPKLWKKFWDHKELFHDVKYAYAITAHRSQGSTYKDVWVDYADVLLNRNRKEAFQCLYVAASRPTTNLYLGGL